MPDIAHVLKAEISRIARREIRTAISRVAGQIKGLKATVRQQRERIAELEKTVVRTRRPVAAIDPEEASAKPIRMSAASIRRHRLRLQLSQKELAQLIGVSMKMFEIINA